MSESRPRRFPHPCESSAPTEPGVEPSHGSRASVLLLSTVQKTPRSSSMRRATANPESPSRMSGNPRLRIPSTASYLDGEGSWCCDLTLPCGADGWLLAEIGLLQFCPARRQARELGRVAECCESVLKPGRHWKGKVTMRNGLPVNNGMIDTHARFISPSRGERRPAMRLKSCCPHCKAKLDLVQPDPNRGDALLGVCARCPAWFLIDGLNGTMSDLGLADRLCTLSLVAMSD